MAQPALTPGRTRRRALFGLIDADGWGWASLKAFVWFILIIFLLGYLPDRAYYFTVFPTIDLGILAWSPINLCPPTNGSLPCPVPEGATLAWQKNPPQITLPTPTVNGSAVQAGQNLLYIGGQHDTTGGATDEVLVARTVGTGNFDAWTDGPKLPAPRTDAAVVAFNSVIYVFGGSDDSGKAQPDAYILSPDQSTGELRDWQTADDAKLPIDLPEPRSGAVAIAVADGIVVAGGYDDSGTPSATVWKSTTDSQGKLGKWVEQAPLHDPQADAIGAQAGSWLWVYGGVGADGQPTNVVQRGNLGTAAPSAAGASAGPGASGAAASPGASGAAASPGASGGAAAASPAASAAAGGGNDIVSWQVASAVNLPGPRANPAGFAANGTLYLVGGADASGPQPQLYWAIPDGGGNFTEWKHLPQSDLPAGLTGSSAVVLGSDAILVGGQASAGVIGDEYRSNLAPQPPFFQLGLVGATVPALKIEGEIGQQLGYLNAAGLSTIDFIVLVLIGWAYAHREQTRALFERLRRRRQR